MFKREDILQYFETSSINNLANHFSADFGQKLKFMANIKGVKLVTSPVALWEIIATNNESCKEQLIYFAQNIFEDTLLMSPSELIISYINNGCPEREPWFNIESSSPIATTWKNICQDTNKTLIYDKDILIDKTQLIRKGSKYIYNILSKKNIVKEDKFLEALQIQIETIYNNIKFIQEDESKGLIDEFMKSLYKISILLIFVLLCLLIDLDSSKVIEFWKKQGIMAIDDQINFICSNYESLVYRGPFIEMAFMAKYQFDFGKTRGLFWDCLHSIYLPYVQTLFSNDEHFIGLKEKVPFENYKKIKECDWPEIFNEYISSEIN